MKKLSSIFAAVAALATVPAMATEATAPATVPSAHIEPMTRLVREKWFFHRHGQSARDILAWRVRLGGFSDAAIPAMIDDESYSGIERSSYIKDYKVLSTSAIPDRTLLIPSAQDLAASWAASPTVAVVAAGNNGNRLCTGAHAMYNDGRLFRDRIITAYTYGDATLMVGAAELDQSIACYTSDIAPDLIYMHAYAQGFCNAYYMSQDEINTARTQITFSPRDYKRMAGAFNAHPDAGKTVCNIEGTSFSAPNVSGHITTLRTQFPTATDHDVYVTALLAASHSDVKIKGYNDTIYLNHVTTINARGLRYDTLSGFGLYEPMRHEAGLKKLEKSGAHIALQFMQSGQAHTTKTKSGDYTVAIHMDVTKLSVRTIFEFRMVPKSTHKHDVLVQGFPINATLTSPSGTSIELPVFYDPPSLDHPHGYRMAVSTTAFLGEQTEGVWILHIPGDKSLGIPTMGDAILSIWGTDPATLNTLLPKGP